MESEKINWKRPLFSDFKKGIIAVIILIVAAAIITGILIATTAIFF